MEKIKRQTDPEGSTFCGERSYCALHNVHQTSITGNEDEIKKRPTWIYYSILVLLIFGCYGMAYFGMLSLATNITNLALEMATNTQIINHIREENAEIKISLKELSKVPCGSYRKD